MTPDLDKMADEYFPPYPMPAGAADVNWKIKPGMDLDNSCAKDLARAVAEAVANSMYNHGVFDDIDFADYKRALLGPQKEKRTT